MLRIRKGIVRSVGRDMALNGGVRQICSPLPELCFNVKMFKHAQTNNNKRGESTRRRRDRRRRGIRRCLVSDSTPRLQLDLFSRRH